MTTTSRDKLKTLYSAVPAGTPLTSLDLARLGISQDLAAYYSRAGWLERLAKGVYRRPGEPLEMRKALVVLQRFIPGFHVGGRTALDWYGLRHYVEARPTLQLYGWAWAQVPSWFSAHFPAEYHRKRLFDEPTAQMLEVGPFESKLGEPLVSEPERALLEVLSEVGVRQTLQEARELMESAQTLRSNKLVQLLRACRSVKTVRLCLQLSAELAMPYADNLKKADLPAGSDRPWVGKTKEGTLVLKR